MSLSDNAAHADDQELARYLLGLLPEKETERLDEASVVDDEFAARLRTVENDLVDAYVADTLPPDLRMRFESSYLSSPRRQARVKFADNFLRAVDRAAASAEARHEKHLPLATLRAGAAPLAFPSPTRHRFALPAKWLAVAALFVIAFGAVVFQTLRLRAGLGVAQEARVSLDQRTRDLERQLADQRADNAEMARELERAREASPAPPLRPGQDAPTVALVLLPQARAIGPVPTFSISPSADRVAFELRLESNEFTRYWTALKDPASNQIVWRSEATAPVRTEPSPVVDISVPARVLKSQHYSLALMGGSPTGDVVGSYTFQIVRR
jgi:hypothetical protein